MSEKSEQPKSRCAKIKGVNRVCAPWKYGCGGSEKKDCPDRKVEEVKK